MRRPLAPTLLALALAAGLGVPGSVGAAAGAAPARSSARAWSLPLAPAPDDFALAQIRFPGSRRRAVARRRALARDLLKVEMQAPYGADYLAVATPRAGLSAAGAQALVLLVNRPSALEDPASVRLRLSATGQLAKHEARSVENPFADPAAAATGLCDLAPPGSALQAGDLVALRSAGAALEGFGVAAAVAQAYDVACGLPYESAFKQVVTGVSTQPQPQPAPPQPTPAPPQPAPAPPAPPVGRLPGEGCVPAPEYACPAALASRSPAAALDGDRRAAARAH